MKKTDRHLECNSVEILNMCIDRQTDRQRQTALFSFKCYMFVCFLNLVLVNSCSYRTLYSYLASIVL